MEDNYVERTIRFKQSTIDQVEKIVQYINIRDKLLNNERKYKPITVDEMIRGSVVREIEKILTFNHEIISTGNKKLGSKFALKNRIKEITKELGLKQLDLSELTGIDRSNLSMIFNNHCQPSADYLLRIWVALGFYPLEEMFYRVKVDK